MIKALALFSAGLDSLLAAKIILDQGVQVEAVHFLNAFLSGYIENPIPEQSLTKQKSIAGQLGIKLHIIDIAQVHLEMVKSPLFGYGKNLNPCIDCRILMLKQAKAYMQRHGFSFLISGEVLGQRPMSQRKDTLSLVERRAQVQGLLLRPLSAKLLAPTIPEEKGWVTREKLFAFSGRSRQAQLALVGELGMKEYLTPAGGCLLTQAEFARKFQDLVNRGNCGLEDVLLLKVGRHFSCPPPQNQGRRACPPPQNQGRRACPPPQNQGRRDCPGSGKIIVGRNEAENKRLMGLAGRKDTFLKLRDFTGPITVARNNGAQANLLTIAARLTARYSNAKDQDQVWVDYWSKDAQEKKSILVQPADEQLVGQMRI